MGIVLKFLLLWELRVWTSHSEQLISEKIFFVLLQFEHQYCSVFLRLKHGIFVVSFVQHVPVILNFYFLLYIILHFYVVHFLRELLVVLVPWCILYKSNMYEHSLFSRLHLWHALTSCSPWLVTHLNIHLIIKHFFLFKSCNRPSVAQRVPGGLGSQISMTFDTWRWWGCQPHTPVIDHW
jgi:hypothetical protein